MDDFISVKVLTLRELFSDNQTFRLPWFQRAYAWQNAEAGRLLTNLFDVADEAASGGRRYSLGTVSLARQPGNIEVALVDGHQRVMTLTILFAVLRDLAKDAKQRALLDGFIRGAAGYRLQTQDNLQSFCEQNVQAPGATNTFPDGAREAMSETECNVLDNRDYFRAELTGVDMTDAVRDQLISTLADGCFVIVKEVTDEDEAWRMLEIEEETGRDFNPADRAKASLLSMMPANEREDCRQMWEDCERKLGAADLHALLHHLRTLKIRKRSERPAETDLAQAYRLNTDGHAFLKDTLSPIAARLQAIRRRDIGALNARPAIAASLDRMSWIEQSVWVPAALQWLQTRGEAGETERFFQYLERLIWVMRLAGIDPTREQRQIIRLLGDIDRKVPVEKMPELEITRALRDSAISNLRSPSFDKKHYAGKVLRRIAVEYGKDPGPVCEADVTIEHILPRGWLETNWWRRNFKTEKLVKAHAHRLGNLTFLNGKDNRNADAQEWAAKRAIYKNSGFPMTAELARLPDWTAAAIEERTERLIRLLFMAWKLEP